MRGTVVGAGQLDGESALGHLGLDERERRRDAADREPRLLLDRHPPRLHLGEVEDVVDEHEQVTAAGAQRGQLRPLLVVDRPGDAQLQQVGVADDRVDRRADLVAHVGQELALRLVGLLGLQAGALRLPPRADVVGDVVAVRHHPGARAVPLPDRVVDEVDEVLLRLAVALARDHHGHLAADERRSRLEHAVEELLEALAAHVRERLEERPPDQLAVAHHLVVGPVDVLEDVLGAAQHGHEGGRLREDVEKSGLGALGPRARRLPRPVGQHAVGGLGDHVEEGHDRPVVVADAAEREGEPGVRLERLAGLLRLVAAAHQERRIVVVHGGAARADLREHRGDLGPDLRPDLRARPAEGRRVLGVQHRPVGVVVDEDEIVAAPEIDGEGRRQAGADGGAQRRRPALHRPQRRGRPVERTAERARIALTRERVALLRVDRGWGGGASGRAARVRLDRLACGHRVRAEVYGIEGRRRITASRGPRAGGAVRRA